MTEKLKGPDEIAAALIDNNLEETEELAPENMTYFGFVEMGVRMAALLQMLEIAEPSHFRVTGEGRIILYRREDEGA